LEEAERKPAIAGHELIAAGKLFARWDGVHDSMSWENL
jgi:hypothetical protein